jgi:hypothetical protein
MKMNEHQIQDLESLISAIRLANEKFKGQVWWRGQRDYSWSLLPSVFRTQSGYDERAGILRFQQRAFSRRPEVPSIEDRSAWLFLMQHYRLPTRLMDWTESPLVASYFAAEIYQCHLNHPKVIEDPDGALFALSPYGLNYAQVRKHGLLMPESPEAISCIAPAFDEHAIEPKHIIAIRPSEVDIRLMVQLSVFTLNGYNVAIDKLPNSEDFILKFKVPSEAKETIQSDLKQIGIRLSNIFPDLEHLAQEISNLAFKSRISSDDPLPGRGVEPST